MQRSELQDLKNGTSNSPNEDADDVPFRFEKSVLPKEVQA